MNEQTSPLIDKLRRQMAAAHNGSIPASDYDAHHGYWSANHASRPYVEAGEEYEVYAPAYLYGVIWYHSNPQRQFDASEQALSDGWDSARGDSPLDWARAKPAVREAWYRVSNLAGRAQSERALLLAASPTAHTPGDH